MRRFRPGLKLRFRPWRLLHHESREVHRLDPGLAGTVLENLLDVRQRGAADLLLARDGAQGLVALAAEQQQQTVSDRRHVFLHVVDRLRGLRHDFHAHLEETRLRGILQIHHERRIERQIGNGGSGLVLLAFFALALLGLLVFLALLRLGVLDVAGIGLGLFVVTASGQHVHRRRRTAAEQQHRHADDDDPLHGRGFAGGRLGAPCSSSSSGLPASFFQPCQFTREIPFLDK